MSEADRALCDYAVKLTLTPGKMTSDDLMALRKVDFDDAQITVATQVIGYFNYINRIAAGLGVDPEPEMPLPLDGWLAKKGRDY